MNTTHVVLRQVKDADDSRLLEASVTANGAVLIEGRDFGDGVERVFGVREYEWPRTHPLTFSTKSQIVESIIFLL